MWQKAKALTRGEFLQFLGHSRGSLLELETQLSIALELRYLTEADHKQVDARISEVLRVLNGLMDSLRAKTKIKAATTSPSQPAELETRNSKLETE